MSERTCYLHVGTGKTGSSAIQYALVKASGDLFERGYHYPDISTNFSLVRALKPTAGNGLRIDMHLRRGGRRLAAVDLVRRHTDSKRDLIVSCEGLWNRPIDGLLEFASGLREAGYQTKCLVLFRPQAEMIVSSYLQLTKSDKLPDGRYLNDYALRQLVKKREGHWNWYERVRGLEEAFGEGNVSVNWYPATRRSGSSGVVNLAFSWLGLADFVSEGVIGELPRLVNPTPGLEALLILRTMNALGLGGKWFADPFLMRAHDRRLLGSKVGLSKTSVEQIHAATREYNAKLLERYCPDLDVSAEIDHRPSAMDETPTDHSTLKALAQIASEILAENSTRKFHSPRAILEYVDRIGAKYGGLKA